MILSNTLPSSYLNLTNPLFLQAFDHLQKETTISKMPMPCKIRKRRFSTASSSSFANSKSLSQLFMETKHSPPPIEKGVDRSACEEEVPTTLMLPVSGSGDRVNEAFEKSITNVERFRNESCRSPGGVYVPEGKSQPCDEIEIVTKVQGHSSLKPTHGLEEIKHSLTVSKQLLKLLTQIWTTDSNHDHHHPTSMSLASTLNHELNRARYHVNKLIQAQRSNHPSAQESNEQDKVRFAVKTISRELEAERKLRRQSDRMNKKLGRELANTRSFLAKFVKKAEAEKRATEVFEQLCEKMACGIEKDRVVIEELRKEFEGVRVEMEEEREMLRVADMLREERVQMKLIDAKHEYEDKHKRLNILVHDLEELSRADNGKDHIAHRILSWYQSSCYSKDSKDENDKVENKENTLDEEIRGLSWFENKVENDQTTSTQNEVVRRNSDCIEWEFGHDLKNASQDSNIGLVSTKEYEDEMERYKMIKDLRDRIVSGGSDLSRDTIEFGSYM